MTGLGKLSNLSKATIFEIARMSYGKHEGANGYASAWHAMFRHVSGVREDTSNVKTVNENNRLNEFGPDGGTVDDNELSKFGQIAHEHQDAENFYVRFTADGLDLDSTGSYNPLRSLKAKRENNYVRQRGKEMLDHLVHDYTLDENGFLHDEGLHL